MENNDFLDGYIRSIESVSAGMRDRVSVYACVEKDGNEYAASARSKSSKLEPADEYTEDNNEKTAAIELKLADAKIRDLERKLLGAEELIFHLNAEKLQALRQVEKLSRALNNSPHPLRQDGKLSHTLNSSPHTVDSCRNLGFNVGNVEMWRDKCHSLSMKANELEKKLIQTQKQWTNMNNKYQLESNEMMQVIREQEQENEHLKSLVFDKEKQARELEEQRLVLSKLVERNKEDTTRSEDSKEQSDSCSFEWKEELTRHPTPAFDLDSPEIQYLLFHWTSNIRKVQYLRQWLTQILQHKALFLAYQSDIPLKDEIIEANSNFPFGVELPRLAPEVKDGFLTLVIPLLRKQRHCTIIVHTRKYNDQVHYDLRIRAIPRLE